MAEAVDLLSRRSRDDAQPVAESLLARVESETGTGCQPRDWIGVPRRRGGAAAASRAASDCRNGRARALAYAEKNAIRDTDRATFQAMEALVHNLNTMHSRAGAQTPF